ncbi:MAG: protein translocase subunit SecD [Patescibacteria group bacterium]|nr:protein translocase subunit SecD [Patescibacteria group bacterium]
MKTQTNKWFSSKKNKLYLSLVLVLIFVSTSFLVVAGGYYNQFTDYLSEKTNNTIVLPKGPEPRFVLGLDLQGGTQLTYEADVSGIPEAERSSSLEGVRDIIERRVNSTGVAEPIIQVNRSMAGDYRVIVELAGVKKADEAIKIIGETPLLEFQELKDQPATSQEIQINENGEAELVLGEEASNGLLEPELINTELSGRNLKKASLRFDPNDGSPMVALEFDSEGAKMFEEITERNIGKTVAIVLDGYVISAPVVNEKIPNGEAVISGSFSIEEAKLLVQRLNTGALPVPITLIGQQTVEASLGQESIDNSLKAGLIGFLLVVIFLIFYYRYPGFLAALSLFIYILAVLAIFKAMPWWLISIYLLTLFSLFVATLKDLKIFDGTLSVIMFIVVGVFLIYYAQTPVTLTLAGITGFILSIGMAVDANILIFERLREELRVGKPLKIAIDSAFSRAWPSIRDGNLTTILICFVLMSFGTGLVKGFGATLFLGVAISMLSNIVITSILIKWTATKWLEKQSWLLGVRKRLEQQD